MPTAPFVAVTGTNGKSTTTALIAHLLSTAGRDVQLGGNIGTRDPVARSAADRPLPRGRDARPSRSTSRRASTRRSAFCSTSRPTISTATARSKPMPRSRIGWSTAAQTAVDRRRRRLVPGDRRPARPSGPPDHPRVGKRRPLPDGVYVDGRDDPCRARTGRRRPSPASPASGRCAARTMRRTPRRRWRRRAGSASIRAAIAGRTGELPGPAAPDGGGRPARPRALRQQFQGDQRRRRGEGAGELRAHLLDRRRPPEGRRHRRASPTSSRASPRPISSARRPRLLPRRSAGAVPHEIAGTLAAAVAAAAARRSARFRAPRRSCCCRRPAPPTTSSRISSGAAMPSARSCARSTAFTAGRRPPDGQPRRSHALRRLVVDSRPLHARRHPRA